MKSLTILTAITCGTLLFTSCKKGEVQGGGNGEKLKSFFSDNVSSNTQHFTINASSGGMIQGTKGTCVTIYPNSLFDASGQLVTGIVDIELVEIFDRASMLMMNKPTMGELPDGNKAPLVSGGEYYLKISQNGVDVNSSNVSVLIPTNYTQGSYYNMSLFDGYINDEKLTWELVKDSVSVITVDTVTNQNTVFTYYSVFDDTWGWTNVDHFSNDPAPKTDVKLFLPDGFNYSNTVIYVIYDGQETVLGQLYNFLGHEYFSYNVDVIPIGLQLHFVAITMINNQLHYAVLPATITNGYTGYINSFEPITQANLTTLITNLP